MIFRIMANPKQWFLLSLVFSVVSLAGAYTAQFGFDMQPCLLCLYQRVPFAVIIVVALFGVFLGGFRGVNLVALGSIGVAFVANGVIAGFHVGVEQGWWQGFAGCSTPKFPEGITAMERLEMIRNTPFVSCTDIQFELLGISMAGYNFVFCVAMGVLTAVSVKLYLKSL